MITTQRFPRNVEKQKEKKIKKKQFEDTYLLQKDDGTTHRDIVKDFSELLLTLAMEFDALLKLSGALGRHSKGSYLVWNNPDPNASNDLKIIKFTRRDLKKTASDYKKQLKSLKEYIKIAKKRTYKSEEERTSKSTNTPVYVGPALQLFFSGNPAGFGSGPDGRALMDSLPHAKAGFVTRGSIPLLMNIYAYANGLKCPSEYGAKNYSISRSDAHMDKCFGSIPALMAYFTTNDFTMNRGRKSPVYQKILMLDAVQRKLLTHPMPTYEVISAKDNSKLSCLTQEQQTKYKSFNPKFIPFSAFQSIAGANTYSKEFPPPPEAQTRLDNPDTKRAIHSESELIKDFSERWSASPK